MGLESTIKQLMNNVDEEMKNETPEQKKKVVKRYISDILRPEIDEKEMWGYIKAKPKKSLKNNYRNPFKFTAEERAERKAKSEAVRNVIIEKVFSSADSSTIERWHKSLLKSVPGDADENTRSEIEKYNEEVKKLFAKDPEAREENEAALYAEERNKNPNLTQDKFKEEISQRRKKIVIDALNESVASLDTMMTMLDETLTADELVKNVKAISRAADIINETEKYLNEAQTENPLYTLSNEERSRLADLKNNIDKTGAANAKMGLIANPCFEYLDINAMMDYELQSLAGGGMDDDGYEFYYSGYTEKRATKDPDHCKNIIKSEHDNLVDFFAEMKGFEHLYKSHAAEYILQENRMADNYELRLADGTEVEPNKVKDVINEISNSGENTAPYVFRKDNRAVIVQNIDGVARQVEPEVLINYRLEEQLDGLEEQMNAADPWYHKSSKLFKNMRKAFDEVKGVNPIQPNEDIKAKYAKLLEKTNDYLTNRNNKGSNDKWTKLHVGMAEELKKYAETKLEQFKYMDEARENKKQREMAAIQNKKAKQNETDKTRVTIDELQNKDTSKNDKLSKTEFAKQLNERMKKGNPNIMKGNENQQNKQNQNKQNKQNQL